MRRHKPDVAHLQAEIDRLRNIIDRARVCVDKAALSVGNNLLVEANLDQADAVLAELRLARLERESL